MPLALAVLPLLLAQADVKLFPVAAPAYTPELGLLVAAGGAMTWNGDRQAPTLPRSSLTAIAGGSTVGAFLLQARLATFLERDATRVNGTLDLRDLPDHFFGVGLRNGLTRPIGRETSLRRRWWHFDPTLLRRLVGSLYAGVGLQLSGSLGREVSDAVLADADFQRHGARVINTGVALTLQLDTRDVPVNASRGLLASATWTGFGPVLGANTAFHAFALDYRQYLQLFRGSTLAWQVKYRTALGDVPWSELTQVGTPFDLRAYRWGQYRERTGFTAVLEYRFMLPFAPDSLWSHFGAAGWVGVGALGTTPLPDFSQVLPAAGLGLRVELLRRITVRLDVGFGRDSRAVYFNLLEAF
jgi:hypothetical protein